MTRRLRGARHREPEEDLSFGRRSGDGGHTVKIALVLMALLGVFGLVLPDAGLLRIPAALLLLVSLVNLVLISSWLTGRAFRGRAMHVVSSPADGDVADELRRFLVAQGARLVGPAEAEYVLDVSRYEASVIARMRGPGSARATLKRLRAGWPRSIALQLGWFIRRTRVALTGTQLVVAGRPAKTKE
jgi:hypothetical protein